MWCDNGIVTAYAYLEGSTHAQWTLQYILCFTMVGINAIVEKNSTVNLNNRYITVKALNIVGKFFGCLRFAGHWFEPI